MLEIVLVRHLIPFHDDSAEPNPAAADLLVVCLACACGPGTPRAGASTPSNPWRVFLDAPGPTYGFQLFAVAAADSRVAWAVGQRGDNSVMVAWNGTKWQISSGPMTTSAR